MGKRVSAKRLHPEPCIHDAYITIHRSILQRWRSLRRHFLLFLQSGLFKARCVALYCAQENGHALVPAAMVAHIMSENLFTAMSASVSMRPVAHTNLAVLRMGANTDARVRLLFLGHCGCNKGNVECSALLLSQRARRTDRGHMCARRRGGIED